MSEMARKRGDAGWADRSVPGWQERVMASVSARERASRRDRNKGTQSRRPGAIGIHADLPLMGDIRRAADSRGMSVAAYVRRAVISFVARDLDVDYRDLLVHCAHPAGANGPGRTVDDGEGYGEWDWHVPVDNSVDTQQPSA